MGFVRANELTIDFEPEHELHGLEVKVRRISVQEFIEMEEILEGKDLLPKIDAFAKVLLSWNLENAKGKAVPATSAGLRSMDLQFTLMLLRAFSEVVSGVPRPLDVSSQRGGPDLAVEASIPMEPV